LEKGWFSPATVIDWATQCANAGDSSRLVLQLASLFPHEADRVLEMLSQPSPDEEGHVVAKWAYVLLAWLYDHREIVDDPWQLIEVIYADLDYPAEIAGLVRYMPAPDENRASLDTTLRRWQEFLQSSKKKYCSND